MPPPVSFIDITSPPFTQLVTIAMFNVANVQWFKYVATTTLLLGTQTSAGGTFTPRTQFFLSDGTTLLGSPWTGVAGGYNLLVPGTYYIKVIRSVGGATDSDFTFTANIQPVNSASIIEGDLIINDDTEGFPAFILNQDGTIKTVVTSFPSGETACILPTGESVWHDRYGIIDSVNRIALFDASGNYVTSVSCGSGAGPFFSFPVFTQDGTKFYVVNKDNELWTITTSGVETNTGFSLPDYPYAIGLDGTTLYWVISDEDTIYTFDITTGLAGPDFYTIPGFLPGASVATTNNGDPGEIFIVGTNLVTFWREGTTGNSHVLVIRLADGILENSIDYSYPTTIVNHLFYYDGDTTHIGVWWYTNGSDSLYTIGRLDLVTETIDEDFDGPHFVAGVNFAPGVDGETKFGISNSCTILRMQAGSSSPTGTIQVIKVTIPPGLTQEFNFTAVGLTPTSFILIDGEIQVYLNVPITTGLTGGAWASGALAPGSWAPSAWEGFGSSPIYGILETPVTGFTTTYVVSNGSPIDNISVDEDEVVVITVTNIAVTTSPASGIYKIVPGKRQDTLWDDDFLGSHNVKIPNPFAETGYIGD